MFQPPRFFSGSVMVLLAVVVADAGCRTACAQAREGGRQSLEGLAAGRAPDIFEDNQGQWNAEILFLMRQPDFTIELHAGKARLVDGSDPSAAGIDLRWQRANPQASVEGAEPLAGRFHHFTGKDPARWRSGVRAFRSVRYKDVYPGVDLVFHTRRRLLEFDWVIAPGADPAAIRLGFGDDADASIDDEGNLVPGKPAGPLLLRKPLAYQEINGKRREVEASFTPLGEGEIGFRLGPYDDSAPLVIDPVLSYSSYLGGSRTDSRSANDGANGVAVDRMGNIILAGFTNSTDFPTQAAVQNSYGSLRCSTSGGSPCPDAFVTKLGPSGELVFSTYLGGGGLDIANAVAVDDAGNVYVAGSTSSDDFPTANAMQTNNGGGFDDVFVAKLDPNGSLVYSTYLGGGGTEQAFGITAVGAGVYLTGFTDADSFPTRNAFQPNWSGGFCNVGTPSVRPCTDGFVTKLDAAGQLDYSTFLGGAGADDRGLAIAVNSEGSAFVTGQTSSTQFPTASALQGNLAGEMDAFITRLGPTGGSLVYSTFLGGSGADSGRAIALDSQNRAAVGGTTNSSNFPTSDLPPQGSPRGGIDGFLTVLNAAGTQRVLSTYFGGAGDDNVGGLVWGPDSQIYLTGSTASLDLPVTSDALQPIRADCNLAKTTGQTWSCANIGLPTSGQVNAVIVDPSRSNTLYAATGGTTVNGGLYKSVNGGQSWTELTPPPAFRTSTRSFAVDPRNPSTLYAGTFFGGVYKSVDGAANWSQVTGGLVGFTVHAVAIDPANSARVFACTSDGGVSRSIDAGANWDRRLNTDCRSLTIRPSNPMEVFAGNNSNAVAQSLDGGETWMFRVLRGNSSAVTDLEVDPADASVAYACKAVRDGRGGVQKTTDAGEFWSEVNAGLTHPDATALAVNPQTPGTLYVATNGGGVFKSIDGGASWNPFNDGLPNPNVLALAIDPNAPSTVYAGASGGGTDAFVARFQLAGDGGPELVYSSFLGGNGNDAGRGVDVDPDGAIYVAGVTDSTNFPLQSPVQASKRGASDAFAVRIAEAIEIHFAQFGNGQGFTAETVLANGSRSRRANGRLSFFSDNGTPLGVGIAETGDAVQSLEPAAAQTSVGFSVAPLGRASISTDGQGNWPPAPPWRGPTDGWEAWSASAFPASESPESARVGR